MKMAVVSLGCTKNQVDSEMLMGFFKEHDFELITEPEKAECILINTCGFIEDAKKEAIEVIEKLEKDGYGNFPICIAKTPASLSDDPALIGRPSGFTPC